MEVAEAQREMRRVYRGGFQGGLVSGALWLASAAASTWVAPALGIKILVFGGFLIFPLTTLLLKLTGGPAGLRRENPFGLLAMQVAFTLPAVLPVVGAAALYRLDWFYPAFMIALGAHYLPFVFMYGMWPFWALAGALTGGGLLIGLQIKDQFALGGWVTGAILILFGFWGLAFVRAEERRSARRAA